MGGGSAASGFRPTLQSGIDDCPDDPDKELPGECGCGRPDTDSDGDGVVDCNDGCPDDADKTEEGLCGCGRSDIDADGDSVADCLDDCPAHSAKTAEGACGCGNSERDSDNDGTPDCLDDCPADRNKVAPGVCGCGTRDLDGDGDGTFDCQDECPLDPERITDVDTDGDGTADCADACPNNPEKIAPGFCACSTEIFNPDGSVDCDQCPDDPDKLLPGFCGCGEPETDRDGDGVPDCADGCPENPNRTASGRITCTVSFDDPSATYAGFYEQIESNLVAACHDWGQYIDPPTPVILSIEVGFCVDGSTPACAGWSPQIIAAARSTSTAFVRSEPAYDVFEPGAAAEVRTGDDPNGDFPDAEVIMGVNFLDSLWFDPDPETRTAPVGDLDAYSVFLHELGHVLAFNGWRDTFGGELPGIASPFDEATVGNGGAFFFEGPRATAVFGDSVPLDASIFHFDLSDELMKATASFRTRHFISDLDLAVLEDMDILLRDPADVGGDVCAGGVARTARSHRPVRLGPALPRRP